MVKKIIHIADPHILNSEDNKPYSIMLKKFLAELYNQIKDYDRDEVRVVIVGDIFENKIKTSNEARALFHEMCNYLNAIANVIIVAGNHDMLVNNKDRYDSISPTFDITNVYENITYADKALNYESGYIIDDNIIWALYSIHDNYNKPNIKDIEKDDNSIVVGLYHGDIVGAVTDTGRMTEKGINFDDFEGCDCVMAGHIHKFQTIKKNGIPMVYAGSLFQHNMGENVSGHGFVIWDMETLTYQLHEVPNDYNIYKFKISSYDDVDEDIERLMNL